MTEPETWCTNWTAYDVPRLWEMVSTEDSREAWAQVSAWFRLRDAVDDQRERLAACREALVEIWPPERSEASAAFVAVLDELVSSMTATVQAASSTATGLAGVLESLAAAKSEIKPLYDEWRVKASDLTPRWFDHAEDELNKQARDAMIKAETAVAQYAPMIQPSPEYDIDVGWIGERSRVEVAESSGGLGSSRVTDRLTPPVPHNPPPPLSKIESGLPETPVLANASLPSSPVAVPPQLPGSKEPLAISPAQSSPTLSVAGAAWLTPSARGLSLAPAAVIGPTSPPVSTVTPPRGTPLGSTAARGIVPGVVAPSATSAPAPIAGRPAGAGNAAGAGKAAHNPRQISSRTGQGYRTPDGHVVTVSGLNGPLRDARDAPRPDPHDPWTTDEGTASIVAPDAPRPHAPGPGVIGIDR